LRKIAAILFLFLFAFNLFGYRILISFLQTKADQQLEAVIDNHEYSDEELIEMRVELNMPYQQRFTEFERHYGQVNIDGKEYTYVKRKIEGDVLILKCISNESKTQLKNIAAEMTKSNGNSGQQNDGPVKSGVKVFGFECDDVLAAAASVNDINLSTSFLHYADKLTENNPAVLLQPPRQV
jgi:hypothetical protein